jgi:hypothetical protein
VQQSATGEADPGAAARDCPEVDSCPLGEGKKEKDFKLIDCAKPAKRAGKGRHEHPILTIFRRGEPNPAKKPTDGPARQNLIAVKFLPNIASNCPGANQTLPKYLVLPTLSTPSSCCVVSRKIRLN